MKLLEGKKEIRETKGEGIKKHGGDREMRE
jgi:hypothetical protein